MNQDEDKLNRLLGLTKEREDSSLDWSHAFNQVLYEDRINSEWPSEWGKDLQVLIYGDFQAPDEPIHDVRLGITVYPDKLDNTVIRHALCVLKATVTLNDKSISSIKDAIRRLNLFLGACTLTNWGNIQFGWWCHIIHGGISGAGGNFKIEEIIRITGRLSDFPEDKFSEKVASALYWMRSSPAFFQLKTDNHFLRSYVCSWNAFECLVEAINVLRPPPRLSKPEKQHEINAICNLHNGPITVELINELYRKVVNPGFIGKAKHALNECFEKDADDYIQECFDREDTRNCFYNIRNAINHGTIDAEDPEERIRIESRLGQLDLMLLQIFGRIVPYPHPQIGAFTSRAARNSDRDTNKPNVKRTTPPE